MSPRDGSCHVEGCSNPTHSKKAVACRPCALAFVRGRHAYAEPCPSYVRGPIWHLDKSCDECGYDSALHPGGGRARLTVPVLVW